MSVLSLLRNILWILPNSMLKPSEMCWWLCVKVLWNVPGSCCLSAHAIVPPPSINNPVQICQSSEHLRDTYKAAHYSCQSSPFRVLYKSQRNAKWCKPPPTIWCKLPLSWMLLESRWKWRCWNHAKPAAPSWSWAAQKGFVLTLTVADKHTLGTPLMRLRALLRVIVLLTSRLQVERLWALYHEQFVMSRGAQLSPLRVLEWAGFYGGVYVSAKRVSKNANFPNLQRTKNALVIYFHIKIFCPMKTLARIVLGLLTFNYARTTFTPRTSKIGRRSNYDPSEYRIPNNGGL